MLKIISRTVVLVAALGLSGIAVADTYAEVWICKVEDDKTIEDVQAANSKWLAYVHANVSEEITSSVITAVVGNASEFRFVDSYPDLATWAATKTRLDSDEAEAEGMSDLFEDVSECSKNRLYKSEPTT
jgi:hypothetical protein